MKYFKAYQFAYVVFAVSVTVFLSCITQDFWSGYYVEVAGILAEVGVIYIAVDWLLKRQQEKLSRPIKLRLAEKITLTHVFIFTALKNAIDNSFGGKFSDITEYNNLKSQKEAINDYLSHSASFLSESDYSELIVYLDSIDEVLYLISFLQNVPPSNASPTISTKEFRAKALQESEAYYEKLLKESGEITKPFFRKEPIQTFRMDMQKASEMNESLSKMNLIKLV